ncbi:MAG: DNA-processing protein DprA [candidate division Zixibacteria bacterium]|nr:DNA-processing protein DprA [candidate division Zixibacteria bacterium]MCK4428475.1 DNA-processing protein DprA [candidate division Zixibacteria bacterium]
MGYREYVIALREKAKIGPKAFQQLLMTFGSPENVYKATKEELLSLPRMTPEKAEEIYKSQDFLTEIREHILYLEELGIGILTILDENYPQTLKEIDDPPPLLYFKGEFPLQNDLFVAVVGTHEATLEGIEKAVEIGGALAKRKVVLVSGLARGIDSAAHLGAIKEGGKTYAIFGAGLNNIYPSENVSLAEQISKSGALITEYNLDVPVKVGRLMARNRIVVGLSQAVIIVEMSEESPGTMDTVDITIKQGKPLFVVRKENSQKVEDLIQEGAVPIEGVDDLNLVLNYL